MQIRPRQLIAAIGFALCCALPAQAERLQALSKITWDRAGDWFGGLSGIEIDEDGRVITVISDRGSLLTAKLVREGDRITGILNGPMRSITRRDGKPLLKRERDPEGLAIAQDGTVYVSFEARHRVARLDIRTGRTTDLPVHPDFATFKLNNGLEALAIHPDGTLYTLPETTASRQTPFPIYAFDGTDWRVAHHIPRRGPFLAVGADFDDAGNLYLLERTITPLGFRSRIRRFDLTAPDLAEITLMTSLPSQYDNLESIGVWRDDNGVTRVTAVSDDNFLSIQTTQIVEFGLTD